MCNIYIYIYVCVCIYIYDVDWLYETSIVYQNSGDEN